MKGTVMDQKTYRKHTGQWFKGRKVKTLMELKNGWMIIPAGTICTIEGKHSGFSLRSSACVRCGVGIRIGRVQPPQVELI